MFLKEVALLLQVLAVVTKPTEYRSLFLEHVKNSTLIHHSQTNTVWEYLGSYSQTEDTENYLTVVPVFQFLCDVFPVRMAYALRACIEYRSRVMENGDVTRLKQIAEVHGKSRAKRQVVEIGAGLGVGYTIYRIVGDLLGPSSRELVHRLEDVETFKQHQMNLNEAMTTSIVRLSKNQLTFIKTFQDVYDDANVTRQYLYQHIRQVIAFRKEYDSFAKHAIVQEMRNHYDKIVQSLSKIEEHNLNIDFLSPDQRSILHDLVYQSIKSRLPKDFGGSLSVFIPKLLVHQIVSFDAINESNLVYALTEKDFQFDVSVDEKFDKLNQTVDLDEIIPKIVGHLRVENMFGLPTNYNEKTVDLFKVTKLPFFDTLKTATQVSSIPTYFSLSSDGYSSEWDNHDIRRCTMDKQSKLLLCAIPVPVYTQIQNPCIRSIVYDSDTQNTDCRKIIVDMFAPQSIRLSSNVYAVSTDSKLQCLEKVEKKENFWTNITKVGIIRTRCGSVISCGKFDFRPDEACASEDPFILSMKKSIAPYHLGESVNEAATSVLSLKDFLNITALINEIKLSEQLQAEGIFELHRNVVKAVRSKWWVKGLAILSVCAIVLGFVLCCYCKNCFNEVFLKMFGYCGRKVLSIFSKKTLEAPYFHSNIESCRHSSAVQVPPPIPPRKRPVSFLERITIPNWNTNHVLSMSSARGENNQVVERFRCDEQSKLTGPIAHSNIVTYALPADVYSQKALYDARAGHVTAVDNSTATSGSFFEEDKSSFTGY